jgi:hypothetical protein
MKRILALGLTLLLMLTGCSSEINDYQRQQPQLDIFHYFQWQDRSLGHGAGSIVVNNCVVSTLRYRATWWAIR